MSNFLYIMNNINPNLHIRLLFDGKKQYFILFLQFYLSGTSRHIWLKVIYLPQINFSCSKVNV